MGYRTYLTLIIEGTPQTVGSFKDAPTSVYLIANYCLGKIYFNALPDELDEVTCSPETESIHFNDEGNSDDGEIPAVALLALCKTIKEKRESTPKENWDTLDDWYWFDPTELIKVLVTALVEKLIQPDTYVQFVCY